MAKSSRPWLATAALLWVPLFMPLQARANGLRSPVSADPQRQQAQALERQGKWYEACCLYDELLSRDRNQPEVRDAYRRCLRQFRQVRRLGDEVLQSALQKQTTSEALDLFDEVVAAVTGYYVERERADLTTLFQQGVKEVRGALEKKEFVSRYLAGAAELDIAAFRQVLADAENEKATSRSRAKALLRKITSAGAALRIPPGVLALECASGACNSLDEYSVYLSPGRLNHAQTALKARFVGIGIELTVLNQKVEISRVYGKSPAAEAGLLRGDRVVRIDGMMVDPLAPELAAERLLGETGTSVEIEVVSRGQMMPRTEKVERKAVLDSSIDFEIRGDMAPYIGYIHIHTFQDSTLQEVRDALDSFQGSGLPLRGLILDLRGNGGGTFKSAVSVAELFLPDSVIVHTHGQHPTLNRTYRSQNMAPFPLPMVVIVDGETASAAEVLAGALKDNQRAVIVGSPTYGKGSIQCVVPLERAPGGLRLTVAKFSSPHRVPFGGRGIVPDHQVLDSSDSDPALRTAENLLRSMGMMMR